jgi:hypothetical protein
VYIKVIKITGRSKYGFLRRVIVFENVQFLDLICLSTFGAAREMNQALSISIDISPLTGLTAQHEIGILLK